MSHTSHLSRYRPAVLVITGAAAAWGIYILYTTFSGQPAKSGLHRSNAVHRRRQPRFLVEIAPPDEDALLGKVVISGGNTKLVIDVNSVGAPVVSHVKELFPDVPEELYPQQVLDGTAVESAMNACFLARGDEQRQARLRRCGVDGISEAMQDGDAARVLSLATPLLHQIVDTDHETIQSATVNYLAAVGLTSPRPTGDALAPEQQASERNPGDSDIAETEELSGLEDAVQEPEQGLKGLLYHIAETDAKRKAYEHRGIHCEECGEKPIRGVRWHCINCSDFDLCSTCEASTTHQKTHVFAKIKIPLPVLSQPTKMHPLWYPGKSSKIWHALPPEMKTYFRQTHDFDEPHIDAYFDQFTSIANVSWKDDPAQVNAAIDRRAFNVALTCEKWPNRFRPNALYDRMFAFYDTDSNGLIGFGEFLNGIAYLRGPKRFSPLTRAIQGFDIEGHGFVNRRDFLRLLRAKYEIQKLLINDMVEGQEMEYMNAETARETLHSSQPISSIFSWEEIPQGEERIPIGKARDTNGDLQPLGGTKTILEDNEGWSRERAQRQPQLPGESHEQLRHHLSRFEEMLSSPTDGAGSPDAETSLAEAARDGATIFNGDTEDPPLDEDVIWQITEDGFNEVLDPMFKAKEEEHRRAIEARPELNRWLEEIVEHEKRRAELKKALQDELQGSGTVDPLLATAMESLNGSVQVTSKEGAFSALAPAFKSDIVPTDHESLTKREEEIAQKPLDELLDATGYSTIDDGDKLESTANGRPNGLDDDSKSSVSSADSELDRILGLDGAAKPASTSADKVLDPTMPQNRPNSSSTSSQARGESNGPPDKVDEPSPSTHKDVSNSGPDLEAPPSDARLEELSRLAVIDQEIKVRNGPGKLSYEEVEAIVQNDSSKELKGLVTGWLEWASF